MPVVGRAAHERSLSSSSSLHSHLAKLAGGLDILEWVRNADFHNTRDTSGEHGFALVLRLQVRRSSHLSVRIRRRWSLVCL